MNIICSGDCGVDHYVRGGQRRAGGITANFALQARSCFEATDIIRLVAPLGNDDDASIVERRFLNSGIECHFEVLAGTTPVQHIDVDESGERRFVGYEEGVLKSFRITEKHAALIADSDLLVAPVFEQNRDMFASIMSASAAGIIAADFSDFAEHPDFDFLNQYAKQIKVAFFGLRSNQGEIIESLRLLAAKHKLLIVVTLGADGSRAFDSHDSYEIAAVPVKSVVDTTGAGDAFAAGFLSRYCRTANIEAALSFGATVAARVVQQPGAN